MNEKFIHAFISKNRPKSAETNKMTSSEAHKKKKVAHRNKKENKKLNNEIAA